MEAKEAATDFTIKNTKRNYVYACIPPAVVILLTILVFMFVPRTYTYGSPEVEPAYWNRTEGISDGILTEGLFVAEKGHVKALSFMLDNASGNRAAGGSITVEIFDENGAPAGEKTLPIEEVNLRHFQEFEVAADVVAGAAYTYRVSAAGLGDTPVCMGMLASVAMTPEDGRTGAVPTVTSAPIMERIYEDSMNMSGAAAYIVCILLIGIILTYILLKEDVLVKSCLMYGMAVAAVFLLILMSDEGKEPLRLNGSELESMTAYAEDTRLVIDDSEGYYGIMGATKDMVLEKGTYTIGIVHKATAEGSHIVVRDNGSFLALYPIVPESSYGEYTFTLDGDCEQLKIQIMFGGEGSLTIREFTLTPEGRFYNDAYFMAFVFVLLSIAGIFLYRRNRVQPFAKESLMTACIVLGFGILAGYPYFSTNLIGADDLAYHLVRIEGIKGAILEGQLPAVIHPEGLNGNGYLTSMYPNMFLYIAAVLRIAGISLALSYKTMMFLANIATAYFTYIALRSMTKSRTAMYLGTALYVLLPYRFTNIYARGAVGEALAMTFLPLIIAGFYHVLFEDKKKWYYLVIGFTGVLQSHVLSTVIMAVIFGIACIIWIKELFQEKRYIALLQAAGVTVLLNLWFLVPFIFFYRKENLSPQSLEWSNFIEHAINPSFFMETLSMENNRYLSLGVPVVCLAAVCLLYIVCERKRTKKDSYLLYLFTVGCVLCFMITGYFASWDFMEIGIFNKLLKMLQFPWRLFGTAALLFLFAGCIWLAEARLLGKYMKIIAVVLVGINLLSGMTAPAGKDNFAYEEFTDTHSTGHAAKLVGIPKSYATIIEPYEWRLNSIQNSELRTAPLASDEEQVTITAFEKEGTRSKLTYTATGGEQYVEFPLLNYIGYEAEDEHGNRLAIETGDGSRLRVALQADGMEHDIYVRYAGPAIFKIAAAVSLLSYIAVAAAVLYKLYKKKAAAGRLWQKQGEIV